MYLLLDRHPIVVITDVRIVPGVVTRGTKAAVVWTIRELRSCQGHVQEEIVDSAGMIFSFQKTDTVYHIVDPLPRTFSRDIFIPRGAAIGPARYRSHIKRWCNFLQEFIWPMEEDGPGAPFVISERSTAEDKK